MIGAAYSNDRTLFPWRSPFLQMKKGRSPFYRGYMTDCTVF
ncbi:MAG: hypothetical protein VKL39_12825 [Leptolyngbyaceae bacterium]|nr:hypothetical protein [Leptolyngbyaceae bacterium]